MKKLDEDFVKALSATRSKSGRRLSQPALSAIGRAHGARMGRNPRVPQQLEKIATMMEKLKKHVDMYSGIDAKDAGRVGRDADDIALDAVYLSAYSDWIMQNARDYDGAARHAKKRVERVRKII